MRPMANTPKVAPTTQGTKPVHKPVAADSQACGPAASSPRVTANGTGVTKNGSGKAIVQPVQGKRTTPWTVEAASRVAGAAARHGDGTVKKGSFAADAMSRAMKNEHNRKGTK